MAGSVSSTVVVVVGTPPGTLTWFVTHDWSKTASHLRVTSTDPIGPVRPVNAMRNCGNVAVIASPLRFTEPLASIACGGTAGIGLPSAVWNSTAPDWYRLRAGS